MYVCICVYVCCSAECFAVWVCTTTRISAMVCAQETANLIIVAWCRWSEKIYIHSSTHSRACVCVESVCGLFLSLEHTQTLLTEHTLFSSVSTVLSVYVLTFLYIHMHLVFQFQYEFAPFNTHRSCKTHFSRRRISWNLSSNRCIGLRL